MPGDPFYTTPEWRALRLRVLKAQGFRCAWCGVSIAMPGTARVDHVQPRLVRPDLALTATNLRGLCVLCDARRHAEKGQARALKVGADANGWPTDPSHHWNAKGGGRGRA
jgi:5-methylcytosine-specific restriction endonuclease McrA